ncbi:MAG: hypothetical protein AMJ54_13500 [Deltaproteobacteria bacterium SG8_13]|nr:MAG: hypothetical protein AMJ54_13500 [Deltaproteobacteria bacterium SG8_13]
MKLAAICIFLVAAVLIVTAASGDLWLDEVISLSFAESASSAWEIVSGFRHDNNHLLNTLYLYWIGRQKLLVIYRLLAILAGIGSIVLVGALAQKWGQIERLFSLLLAGTSYPLVLYFSEARGYSPAIFFALLSLAILLYRRHHMNLLRLAAFWLSLCLGLLAHSTFVIVLIALGATVLVDSCRRNPNLKFCSLMMARFFLVPVLFSAGFYVFFVRNMHIEGGPVFNKWEVICRAAALALGFSEWGLFPTAALLVVIVAMVVGTVLLYQDGSFLWVFFPTVLLAAPFLVVAATRPTYLYFRYFLICTPFLYLLLGYLLGRWYRSAFLVSRLLVVALLVAFVFSQALRLAPLLQSGRGSYRAAVRYLEANTDGNEIRVGSDHDFRNQVLLSFYARFLSPGVRLAYIEQPGWKTDRPEWIITHSQNPAFTPPDRLELRGIGHYRLTKEFRFAAISGWHWFLFHKEADR